MQQRLLERDSTEDDVDAKRKSSSGNLSAISEKIFNSKLALFFIALIMLALLLVALKQQPSDTASVPTTAFKPVAVLNDGIVAGFSYNYYDSAYNSSTLIYAWRGIPYAEAPLGSLRWAPPSKLQPWSGILSAGPAYSSPCIQSYLTDTGNTVGSEDCLFLNVYTSVNPSVNYGQGVADSSSALNPVLFFIYGGGLMNGEANASFDALIAAFMNNASSAVPSDIGLTVVEVSYRLNAFGFLATRDLSLNFKDSTGTYASGNYGIQDQILALEWTRDNIARFGGDPKRVTIAGQSSGGTSVFALIAAAKNKTNGLFQAGISMSGSLNITMTLRAAEVQNANFSFGCHGTSSDVVRCMQDWTAAEVVQRISSGVNGSWSMPCIWNLPREQSGQHYQGLVVVDNYTIIAPFASSLAAASGADVPLIIGNMAQEPDEGPERIVTGYTPMQWQALLNSTFSSWSETSSPQYGHNIATTIGAMYRPISQINPQKAFDAIVADYGLFCAQIQIAKYGKSQWYKMHAPQIADMYGNYKSNIFLYYNTWALSKSYVSPWAGNIVQFAFHDLFYFMVTGQWDKIGDSGSYVPTARDISGSRLLQSLWREFLRDPHRPEIRIEHEGQSVIWQASNVDAAGFDFYSPTVGSGTSGASAAAPSAKCYSNYSILFISTNVTTTLQNYRQNICSYYNTIGLDKQDFWWVN